MALDRDELNKRREAREAERKKRLKATELIPTRSAKSANFNGLA